MKKLRIGVISTARIGERRVIPAIQKSSNASVSAVASRDLARAQTFAAALDIPKAYGSYEAMLADSEIDAVYNPLPNSLHAEWTIKAAQAGKHVLCEKPFAANLAEVDAMIAACAQHNVYLLEAFMYRFHPQNVKVVELVRNGAIGAVKLVRGAFCFAIASETNIRLDASLAGGALMDIGCYPVSAARMTVGAEPTRVSAIAQWGARSRVDETMSGVLEFANGAQATFDCSLRSSFRSCYEVIGERGRIEVPLPFVTNNLPTKISLHHPDDSSETFAFPEVDQYTLMAEHFADCIQNQKPLRWTTADSRAQQRVLDALYESARSGKAVEV